jgi:hypothetical protein
VEERDRALRLAARRMKGKARTRGEDKGKDWVEKASGWSVELVERPRKPAPKEIL